MSDRQSTHNATTTDLNRVVPNALVHGLVVHEQRAIVLTSELIEASVQTTRTLIEQHLTRLQRHRVELALVVFDLDGPRLIVIVVFMSNVNDR